MNFSKANSAENIAQLRKQFIFNLPFWISAAVVAIVSVIFAKFFNLAEEWAFSHSTENIIYVTAPIAILGSFLLGHFFSKEALGSGIPQIIASIELSTQENSRSLIEKMFSFRMMLIKVLGSCLCTFGGGSTGREGPTLQISAALFYQIEKYWPKKMARPQLNMVLLAGSAGGLAAAFNTPLGGVVFAIEELSKTHISLIRTSIFQAVIIAGLISQIFLGNYLYLTHPQFNSFDSWLLLQTLITAALVGLAGALFAEGLYLCGRWRAQQNFTRQFLMTVLCGVIFALLIRFCGVSTLGGGKRFMLQALESPSADSGALISAGRIFGNFFTYIAGVVGGIFAPSLASGAALGQWMSSLFGFEAPRIMMLAGMVAFLTGVTRTPMTAFVLVLEMTNSHEIVLYLMLAALVASLTSYLVNPKSFYEQAAHDIKAKLLPKELHASPVN